MAVPSSLIILSSAESWKQKNMWMLRFLFMKANRRTCPFLKYFFSPTSYLFCMACGKHFL
jgi:hypothetical protein